MLFPPNGRIGSKASSDFFVLAERIRYGMQMQDTCTSLDLSARDVVGSGMISRDRFQAKLARSFFWKSFSERAN